MSIALEMTTKGHDAQWEESYERLAYTAFALGAHTEDEALGRLFTEVRGLLADWENIETDRRQLRAQAIAARVGVRVADAALDRILHRIAQAVLEETGGKADHELYQRLFPEPHERVIALGLDAELPLASVVMAQLDDGDVPGSLKTHMGALRACLTVGNGALSQRADAYANLGRLQARVEAWLEGAEASRRAVRGDLAAIAEERGLGDRWSAIFFP